MKNQKNLKKGAAIGGSFIAGLLAFPSLLLAAPTAVKDSAGVIYINGLAPSTKVAVSYNSAKTHNVTTNACGLLLIKPSANYPVGSTLHINGTAIDVATLPSAAIPKCSKGTLASPVSSNFKAPNGTVVIGGLTARTHYPVTYDGSQTTRTVTVNACGFAKLTSQPKYPVSATFSISGTSFDPATIATSNPPICRKGVKYTPN